MFTTKTALVKIATALLILTVAAGSFVRSEEGAGICETAFWECLNDPLALVFSWMWTAFCIEGYLFCKKYVDPERR
jgi:hypothetical protein